MKKKFGPVTLIHGDNLVDMQEQNANSWDFVYFDPMFNADLEFLIPRIDEAARILKVSGNIAFLEKPSVVLEISHYIKTQQEIEDSTVGNGQSWRNIREMETISIPANVALAGLDRVAYSTRMYHLVTKGTTRNWYGNKGLVPGKLVVDTEAEGLTTDNWSKRCFKGGRSIKVNGKRLRHPAASPKWAIEDLLSLYIKQGHHRVYDAFGGSGRVPEVCYEYGIECRSVEIDKDNFEMMCEVMKRVQSTNNCNKIFASHAVTLTKKARAHESGNYTSDGLERSVQRSTYNSGKDNRVQRTS